MLQRLGQVARLPDLLDNHVRPGFGDRVLDVRVGVAGEHGDAPRLAPHLPVLRRSGRRPSQAIM